TVSHAFALAGDAQAVLRVTDAQGCTGVAAHDVTVLTCDRAATLPSVECRLDALRTLVTSNVATGALQNQLLAALSRARAGTARVEALRAGGNKRRARFVLGRAISAL